MVITKSLFGYSSSTCVSASGEEGTGNVEKLDLQDLFTVKFSTQEKLPS
jgi:hypothetical protein